MKIFIALLAILICLAKGQQTPVKIEAESLSFDFTAIAGEPKGINIPNGLKTIAKDNLYSSIPSLGQIQKGTETDFIFFSRQAGTGSLTVWLGTTTTTGTKTIGTYSLLYLIKPNKPQEIDIEGKSEYKKQVGDSLTLKAVIEDAYGNKIDDQIQWYVNNNPYFNGKKLLCNSALPDDWQIQACLGSLTSQSVKILWLGSATAINIKQVSTGGCVGDRFSFSVSTIDSLGHHLSGIDCKVDGADILSFQKDKILIKPFIFGSLSLVATVENLIATHTFFVDSIPNPPQKVTSRILKTDFDRCLISCDFTLPDGTTIKEDVPFLPEYVTMLATDDPDTIAKVNTWIQLRILRVTRKIEEKYLAEKNIQK